MIFLFVYIFYIRPIFFLYFSSDSEKSLNASRRPFSQIDEDEDVEVENPEIRINEENPNEVSCAPLFRNKMFALNIMP